MHSLCSTCGASYAREHESCHVRFDTLLALDHSRREPWGSRHGQAFAAFVLQHPDRYPASLDHAWATLYRIYAVGETAEHVFNTLRLRPGALPTSWRIPPRPHGQLRMPNVTIADLGDFSATTYPSQLDAWCRAALEAWGLILDAQAP
jgi:hypothetical protein